METSQLKDRLQGEVAEIAVVLFILLLIIIDVWYFITSGGKKRAWWLSNSGEKHLYDGYLE